MALICAWLVVVVIDPGAQVAPTLVTGMLFLLAVGIADDVRGLSTSTRFAAQIAVSLAMVYVGDVRLVDFGQLLWPGQIARMGWASTAASVFCVVGVINALNMIDGMDGLSGTLSLIALAALAGLAAFGGRAPDAQPLLLGCAALLPFLAANLRWRGRRARVFLGNGGSMALGLLIGWYCVAPSQGPQRAFAPVTALWLFAVPLIDTVSVMWRRMARGESPFRPGHDHVHHLLQRLGFSVNATLAWLAAWAIAMVGIGVAGEVLDWPEAVRFYGFLAVAFAYHFWAVGRWRSLSGRGKRPAHA
jgi:UDP-GlcNAc:undecaprenyl-phosphate GlcNAc-1-phosphate transferase